MFVFFTLWCWVIKVLYSAVASCLTFVRPKFGIQTLNLLLVMLHALMTFMTIMTLVQHLACAEKQKQTVVTASYSLSRKTVNARENFWNVYCSATNQMRDETARDNPQTAE